MSKTTTANPVSSALARRSGVLVLALLFCAWWSGAAMAQGASRDCTLTLAPLNFGNYDPLETTVPLDRATTMNVDGRRHTFVQIFYSHGPPGSEERRVGKEGVST